MPERFLKETKELFEDNDPLLSFINNKLEITNNNKDVIYSSKLYELFTNYCSKGTNINSNIFKDRMIKKGFVCKRTTKGNCFCGIKIITVNEFEDNQFEGLG